MIKVIAGACAAAAAAPLLVILLIAAGPAPAPAAVKLTAPSGLSGAATAAAEALIPADYLVLVRGRRADLPRAALVGARGDRHGGIR